MGARTAEPRRPRSEQGDLFVDSPRSFHLPRHGEKRIGVVDVGSNSVRMVVFEGGRRCPAVVFNERVLCGLGARLATTGALDIEGKGRALRALRRFASLAPGLGVGALAGVATAALRDAEDGPSFRDEIEAETGIRLEIASGEHEARLAALGVIFGDPRTRGIVVDLGGASMELCPVAEGRTAPGVTTPLGPQRFEANDGAARKTRRAIDRELEPLVSKFESCSNRLWLVGGAWRALAKVEMARTDYPMGIIHEFRVSPEAAQDLARFVRRVSPSDLAELPGVSSARVGVLAHAGRLLEGLIKHFNPEEIIISGFGLREGVCYQYLPPHLRDEDPLLSTCRGQERSRARAPGFGAELSEWLKAAFPAENEEEARLIAAACFLSDICWRAHPDYRAPSCLEAVTRNNLSSARHEGRAYIGAALLTRYKGGRKALSVESSLSVLPAQSVERAVRLGALMRLGCTISGATPGVLPHCPLSIENDALVLSPEDDSGVAVGEEVEKRLAQAARSMELTWFVRPA